MFSDFVQIPVSTETKKSLIKWKDIKQTPDLSKYPNARIANITGKINDIIIVDVDKPKDGKDEKDGLKMFKQLMKSNPETLTYKTNSGGRHYYFKYDDDINTKNIGVNGYSIDVLSNNNYGIVYDILYNAPIQLMPENVKEFIMSWRNRGKNKPNKNDTKQNQVTIPTSIEFNYLLSDVIDLLNKLPEKYYSDFKLWMSVTSALKSVNLREQWETFSKKSEKYDEKNNHDIWEELTPNIDLTFLSTLQKKEGIKSKLKVHRWCSKLDLFTIEPNEIRNEQYIDLKNFDYDEHSLILIKSATGTGKTTATADLIKKIRHGYNYRILSIVSRVSLSQQHKKNFAENGIDITSYQDIERDQYSDCKNLVIQVDSIIHIDPKKLKNTILFLDEINSLLDYVLNSSTLCNKRLQVYNMLCVIMGCSSYIVGVDADLSDIVIKFFKFFDLNPYVIHNKYQNASGKVTQYKCSNKLIADMKAKLKRDEKFICCFDSLTYQDKIKNELLDYCERNNLDRKNDFLLYSSKDGDDNDLRDTQKWKNKYVFYTPKIVYGVDFVPDAPTCVYAFFQCTSVNPLAFSQMVSRCRNIKHLRYFIRERNSSLMFMNASEIKDNSDVVLKYLEKTCDELDPIKDEFTSSKKKLEERYAEYTRFMEYNPRTDEIVIATSIFDQMFWQQQYYNAIMRSSMNHHFQAILKEKGYNVMVNNDVSEYKIDNKKLTEMVKEDYDNIIDHAINDPDDSLSETEKKVKKAIEKRADILHISIDNDKYRDELSNDKQFVTHLNICSLMNANHDEKLINKTYKEFKVQNITSNAMKLKLIHEVQTIMNISPLCINDRNNDAIIPDDKKDIIKKVFRINDVNLISMYRNIVPGLLNSQQRMVNGVRSREYEIDFDVITHHLDLLSHRNKKMTGIDVTTLNYFGYVPSKPKKLF